ncbi:FlgD immunoglobulin-like domain containing protein [Pseudotenacibaculum sp. MALMAid0570]|uniref:FlgD immunoglobulin-like domain containing protein n=1 Tax=Pseudotenacibaculum sp. MALMAid0570 TaxID=3143938 RepID=UPI0032DE6B21
MKKIIFLIFILFFTKGFSQIPAEATLETGYTITSHGYILYPSPDSNYANVIEVGPGKQYQEIHDIPLTSVVKNTLIKIFRRTDPYRTKVFVDVIGTENERVRFQGIPDANGNLPVISFENATTWGNTTDATLESGSAFVVFGTWSNKPAWIDIVNLHIKDAPYASVWAKGDHISVKGCILENSANGVFFQAANQLLIEISTYILIEGCKFTGNGTVNGWLHHNIYAQGMHTLIQFNNIEALRTGAFGASLKDRSSHTVIRYNKIETSARTLDLVEPEDTDMVLTTDPNWDDVYVYGNLLINKDVPVTGAGVNMVHYGYDNTPTFRREGTLYFFNNTIAIDRNDGIWRVNLFDVNSTNSVVEFSNNIVTAIGMQTFYIFRSNNTDNAGSINFDTSYFSILNTQNNWQLTENAGSYFMTGDSNIIEGTDPGFVNANSNDFTLNNNSPCIGNGVDLMNSLGLSVGFNSVNPHIDITRSDYSAPSLGCFSSTATASIDETIDFFSIKSTAYPNPFNEQITIEYTLKDNSQCSIIIYNSLGQKVKTLVKSELISGVHHALWDGKNDLNQSVSKGLYYLVIQANNKKATRSILYN